MKIRKKTLFDGNFLDELSSVEGFPELLEEHLSSGLSFHDSIIKLCELSGKTPQYHTSEKRLDDDLMEKIKHQLFHLVEAINLLTCSVERAYCVGNELVASIDALTGSLEALRESR